MVKNCWASELGQAAMAEAELESREGMKEPNSWKIWLGEWWVFLRVVGSKRDAVSWRNLWKTAWVAESLVTSAPTQSTSRREQRRAK